METVTLFFWLFLCLTLGGLGCALFTGFTRRRRVHLVVAPVTLVLLVVTIVLAERMGAARSFPRAELDFHLNFAYAATFMVLPVVATGIVLLRSPRWRRVHLACVVLFLAVACTAVGTGIWVFGLSSPK